LFTSRENRYFSSLERNFFCQHTPFVHRKKRLARYRGNSMAFSALLLGLPLDPLSLSYLSSGGRGGALMRRLQRARACMDGTCSYQKSDQAGFSGEFTVTSTPTGPRGRRKSRRLYAVEKKSLQATITSEIQGPGQSHTCLRSGGDQQLPLSKQNKHKRRLGSPRHLAECPLRWVD
jgi:hypothetical protein